MALKYPFHGIAVYRLKEIITLAKLPKYFGGDLFFYHSQLKAHFNHLTVTAVSGLLLCLRMPSNTKVLQQRIFNKAFGKNLPAVARILMSSGKNLRGPQLTWLSSSYHCLGDTVSCKTQCTTSLCLLCSMKPLAKTYQQ